MAKKTGRKSKYYTHIKPNLNIVADLCRNGATDEIIYKRLGVGKDSWYRYKKEHTDFSDILKRNKDVVDSNVENELLNRALGHKIKEEKAFKLKTVEYNEKGYKVSEEERIEVVELEREIPGDVTAEIFWLKNRRSDKWRDKQNIEHSGNIGTKEYADMTDEEIEKLALEKGIKVE